MTDNHRDDADDRELKELNAMEAANKMRNEAGRQVAIATRTATLWTIILIVVSAVFAALTMAAFRKVGVDPITAYLMGVLLHLFLGAAKVGWQWTDAHRRSATLFQLFVFLLVAAILVVAYFRADLQVERGQPVLAAYLVSAFMALIEIVAPLVAGTFLGHAIVRREFLSKEYQWAREFATTIPTQMDKLGGWHDEARNIKGRIEQAKAAISTYELEEQKASAEHDAAAVRHYQDLIAAAKADIDLAKRSLCEDREMVPRV